MKYIKAYLDKLSILQKIEYIVLFLLAFTIPIGWQVATKIVVLLIVVMVIRCVAEKGRGLSLKGRHTDIRNLRSLHAVPNTETNEKRTDCRERDFEGETM